MILKTFFEMPFYDNNYEYAKSLFHYGDYTRDYPQVTFLDHVHGIQVNDAIFLEHICTESHIKSRYMVRWVILNGMNAF